MTKSEGKMLKREHVELKIDVEVSKSDRDGGNIDLRKDCSLYNESDFF